MQEIKLIPLEQSDREQFIKDNQEAFNFGALEEFGRRNERFEEEGEIISRDTIEKAIGSGKAYRIVQDGRNVGGIVIRTEYDFGDLELLFVSPSAHSKGIGFAAWCAVEELHPEVTLWETVTPYFEKRNIHFYVNRCGFSIVEFFNEHHRAPGDEEDELFEMFRFEKRLPVTPEAVQEQIKRISYYEGVMQRIGELSRTGNEPELKKLADELEAYYTGSAWKRDFAADEAGLLPRELRRGVLSEDGIYDLLEDLVL
jgi:GNAT superfamily N-acetyltransferase